MTCQFYLISDVVFKLDSLFDFTAFEGSYQVLFIKFHIFDLYSCLIFITTVLILLETVYL